MEITQHARYTCTFCGKASSQPPIQNSQKRLTVQSRTPSSAPPLESGSAVRAKRSLREALGPFRRLLLRLFAGTSASIFTTNLIITSIHSTIRRLRELTEA